MSRSASIVLLFLLAAVTTSEAAETALRTPIAFEFSYANKDRDGEGLPYFLAFPNGKDKDGRDASKALSTLKFARGKSRLYPEQDAQPGMMVVLRRIVLVPRPDGDYTAILEGEFNAVQTVLKQKVVNRLLSGEVTDLVFESDTTKGVRPVAFRVEAKTRFRAALKDGELHFYGGEGGSRITHYGLAGTYVYESEPVPLGDENNREPIYIGKAMKPALKRNGEPETLPVIN